MDKNAVLRSLGFRGGPDPVVYPYWKEYEMDSLRRDLASIVWCREKVILVVSFEVWRREKVKKMDSIAWRKRIFFSQTKGQ